MNNLTQIERYKNLIRFIDENFKQEINIEKIEEVSHYSYRNINRIFQSLHHETIGKHIKRIRLDKAAEYLKYSNEQIFDIALDVGFSDIASFSKAFKKRFDCSPTTFRQSSETLLKVNQQFFNNNPKESINFTTETLPEFDFIYLEHKGNTQNIEAIEQTWNTFFEYTHQNKLPTNDSIFFSETLDDNEITDDFKCRTNVALILNEPINFALEGLFNIKKHSAQKYAKFIHKGANENLVDTYNHIYSAWMTDVKLEFEDKPTLEFYINHHEKVSKKDLITEIYIPIQ